MAKGMYEHKSDTHYQGCGKSSTVVEYKSGINPMVIFYSDKERKKRIGQARAGTRANATAIAIAWVSNW